MPGSANAIGRSVDISDTLGKEIHQKTVQRHHLDERRELFGAEDSGTGYMQQDIYVNLYYLQKIIVPDSVENP